MADDQNKPQPLVTLLTKYGLLTEQDDRKETMKALTANDRADLRAGILREFNEA